MQEHQAAELLDARPEALEFRIGQLQAVHHRRYLHAAQSERLHRMLELLDRQFRVLQRYAAQPYQPVRMLRHQRGDVFVDQAAQLARKIRIGQ